MLDVRDRVLIALPAVVLALLRNVDVNFASVARAVTLRDEALFDETVYDRGDARRADLQGLTELADGPAVAGAIEIAESRHFALGERADLPFEMLALHEDNGVHELDCKFTIIHFTPPNYFTL